MWSDCWICTLINLSFGRAGGNSQKLNWTIHRDKFANVHNQRTIVSDYLLLFKPILSPCLNLSTNEYFARFDSIWTVIIIWCGRCWYSDKGENYKRIINYNQMKFPDLTFSFSSQEIIRHPYHSATYRKNDIALIRLALRISFRKSIRPACLETDIHDVNLTTQLTQIGWGIRESHRVRSEWIGHKLYTRTHSHN